MNELLKNLKEQNNVTFTQNGAVTYKSTMTKVYDMFAQGAAMRGASDEDCILMFIEAYEEDPTMALKCLFYLRDIRGGQGERRFFRLCIKWLATNKALEMVNLIHLVPEYGRYDDLFELFNTGIESEMMGYIKFIIDKNEDHLIYKWMPSINTSSRATQERGRKFARAFGMTEKAYRKMLSEGRKACHLVETLMSQNQWDQIAFDKLPSRAGILYSKAFARREETKERYAAFMSRKDTKVNASTLYPYDVVAKAVEAMGINEYWNRHNVSLNDVNRLAANKYWENLTDYFNGATLNALCVCDTSGSMTSGYYNKIAPIDVAIALSLYTAERAKGPFQNHFISFSSHPTLIETTGVDFCDKVARIYRQNLCENTNIEATFDLILNTAKRNHLSQEDMPENIIIVSDMQFDSARGYWSGYGHRSEDTSTLMEHITHKWMNTGYKMPKLIFWNVNAATGAGNIPMKDEDGITFVSGASPSIFTSILTGKTGQDLMYEALMATRYEQITSIYYS